MMKRILLLDLMKFLFVCYFTFSSLSSKGVNLIVSGISSPADANGTYLPFETLNGHDSRKHESKEYYIYYKSYNSIPYWNIDVDTDDADVLFFSESNPPESSPTLVVSWTTLSGTGSPNVIEETLFPEISVSGNNTYITSGDVSSGISDFTEFTYAEVTAGTSARTYTITNGGGADLLIGSITFTGTNAADFSVTSFPLSTIAKTTSSDFIVTFNPSGEGIRTATISISNNDSDENPFTFAISGEGIVEEDLSVTGIINPSTANGTYAFQGYLYGYPYWRHSSETYYLYNDVFQNQRYWNFDVNLSDDEGTESNLNDDNGLFYKLSTNGTPKGLSDWDSINAPYTGVPVIVSAIASPEIDVTGNSKSINSGDVTPDFADYTHFGSLDISSGTRSRTYTIKNSGNATLTLSGSTPYVSINGDAASDFTITSPPSNSIAPGSSTTFTVSFDASSDGDANASISISNNDSNESTYTFNIRGSGFSPENIELSGVTNPSSANGVYVHQGILFEFQYWKFVNGADTYYIYNDEYDGIRYWNIDRNTVDDDGVEGNISDDDFLFFTGNISVTPVGLTGWSRNTATGLETEGTPVFGTKEIFVEGNAEQIVDGDTAPSLFDHTDFGSVSAISGTVVRTFTIGNSGNLDLSLTDASPYVAISGDAASDFSVTSIPSSTISGGSSTTFQITFDPSASGIRSATLSIANDDNDENPFNFSIQGTGLNTAPTASSFTTSSGPYTNNVYTFSTSDFGYSDGDSDPLDHVRVTAIPGSGTLYIDADNGDDYDTGEELANNDQISKANLDAGNLQFYTTSSSSTSFIFDVNDGTDYSASTYTATVSVSDLSTATYTGIGNWSNSGNWSPGFPGTTTNVTINGVCTVDGTYACGNLTIRSDASSTASLLGQEYLTVNGTTTVERYLTGNKWHLVSSSVSGESYTHFLVGNDNIPANGDSRGMMNYNEGENGWNEFFTDAEDGSIIIGAGYALRTNGDGIVEFQGTGLSPNDVAVTLSKSGSGWNLVGNPFPSALKANSTADAVNNLLSVNSSVLDASYVALYIWDEQAGYDGTQSDYVIINHAGGDISGRTSLEQDYIQSGQGFFVKAASNNTTFNITTAMQTHQSTVAFKSGQTEWATLSLEAREDETVTSTSIKFRNDMTTGLDVGYDAGVFKTGFDIYTKLVEDNGVDFALQTLPLANIGSYEIPVGVNVKEAGDISFSMKKENFSTELVPVLKDKLTGEQFAFSKEDDVYITSVSKEANGYGRFTLTFSSTTGVNDNLNSQSKFRAWYSSGAITISGEITGESEVTVFDVQGRKLASERLTSSNQNRIEVPQATSGVYLVWVKDVNRSEMVKVVRTGN